MSDFTESSLTYEEPSSVACGCCAPADYAPIAEPVVAEPVAPEPVAVAPEPIAVEPVVAEPVMAEPAAPEPVIAEPAGSQSAVQQSAIVEPSVPAPAAIATIGGETPGVTSPIEVITPGPSAVEPQGPVFSIGTPLMAPDAITVVEGQVPAQPQGSDVTFGQPWIPNWAPPEDDLADIRGLLAVPGMRHNGPLGYTPQSVMLGDIRL